MSISALIPAEERQAYLDDWKQAGALTAMLNWYRASDLVVPGAGRGEPRAGLEPRCPSPQ